MQLPKLVYTSPMVGDIIGNMRYTVLTYIFGNYEKVHEILEKDSEAEYLLITDNKELKSNTWEVIYDPMPSYSLFRKCYEVRFHPFRYAHTSVVVRVDGSMEIRKSLRPLIDKFESESYERCFMLHPHRNTMPDEYAAWITTRGYDTAQANKIMSIMQSMGYSMQYKGLIEAGFEIVRDLPINHRINDLVFGMHLLVGPNGNIERVDQTLLSFVVQRFFEGIKLLLVSERIITDGNFIQHYHHNTTLPVPLTQNIIAPYLFNKPCETWI